MSGMWRFLDAFTLTPKNEEREVNHNNEWGGYSRKLRMPVFTGWSDHLAYDKESKVTTALVADEEWAERRPIGSANQQRWIDFAERENAGIAAFFVIHAKDKNAELRKVQFIDDDKVFVGKLRREGGKVYLDGRPKSL